MHSPGGEMSYPSHTAWNSIEFLCIPMSQLLVFLGWDVCLTSVHFLGYYEPLVVRELDLKVQVSSFLINSKPKSSLLSISLCCSSSNSLLQNGKLKVSHIALLEVN